jgi:hypothetical protein
MTGILFPSDENMKVAKTAQTMKKVSNRQIFRYIFISLYRLSRAFSR